MVVLLGVVPLGGNPSGLSLRNAKEDWDHDISGTVLISSIFLIDLNWRINYEME